MPTQPNLSFAPGIVTRLRIAFLIISAMLICTMAFGFIQLRKLSDSVDQLALSAVSVFVKTEETERGLKNLLVLLQNVENIDQLSELGPHDVLVQLQLSDLHEKMVDLIGDGPSTDTAKDMTLALEEINESVSKIVGVKQAMLAHEQNLERLDRNLTVLHEKTQFILEDMSYEDSILAFPLTLDGTANRTTAEIVHQYHQLLLRANRLAAISHGLDAVIEAASGLNHLLSRDELEAAETVMRFKMGNIATCRPAS